MRYWWFWPLQSMSYIMVLDRSSSTLTVFWFSIQEIWSLAYWKMSFLCYFGAITYLPSNQCSYWWRSLKLKIFIFAFQALLLLVVLNFRTCVSMFTYFMRLPHIVNGQTKSHQIPKFKDSKLRLSPINVNWYMWYKL